MGYVLDTNIFNKLLDGRLDHSMLPSDRPLLATRLQLQELNRTKDSDRREFAKNSQGLR
jgi:hypothetical protein